MGVSWVEFEGREFEASDVSLEIWLALLVDEIDKLPSVPEWLRQARDEWDLSARERFNFGVVPNLDKHLGREDQKRLLHQLCKAALSRLKSFGDPISASSLSAVRPLKNSEAFTKDVAASVFLGPAENFMHLVSGEPLAEPA